MEEKKEELPLCNNCDGITETELTSSYFLRSMKPSMFSLLLFLKKKSFGDPLER